MHYYKERHGGRSSRVYHGVGCWKLLRFFSQDEVEQGARSNASVMDREPVSSSREKVGYK